MSMTQLQAQSALTAHLATQQGRMPTGACVTLLWQRSYLPWVPKPGAPELQHEFKAFGFDDRGKYTEALVQDSALRDIVWSNFDISRKSA